MPITLDTEWTAEKKDYRLQDENIQIAEARYTEGGIAIRFFDDHAEVASCVFHPTLHYPNWATADYAVLLVAEMRAATLAMAG